MKGMTLKFSIKNQVGTNAMGDPIISRSVIVISDCLVEPVNDTPRRDQMALDQGVDQVRVHIPKNCNAKLGGATFMYDGKVFMVDSDSVEYMIWNTPTRWNRNFKAQAVEL